MAFNNGKISDIRKRLQDWLVYSVNGSNVPNLDLDLLNRANQWLQDYRRWDSLVKTITLTMDETGRVAILPTDVKAILEVFTDNLVVGKPTIWFYEDCPDVAFRYTKQMSYDKSTGGYWTITFPSVSPLLTTPKMKYISILSDFVGYDSEGNEIVEYSFFPPELLLRCAQKLFAEEKGMTGDNINGVLASFNEQLKIYEQMAQFNNQQPDLTPKNKFGQPIKIYGHSMDGQNYRSGYSPYTPAQQAGLHGY